MLQFLLALLAGVVTIGGPCILPLLPIILGTSTVRQHKLRPFAIVAGFSLVFTVFAVLFSLFGAVLGLSPGTWRIVAAVMIGLFGFVMLFPRLQARLFAGLELKVARLTPNSRLQTPSLWSGFLLGASLGAVWTPCAGPILGSILTLIAAKQNLAQAGLLLFAFALGAGVPMLLIAYGGQAAMTKVRTLSKYSARIQQLFGALIILVAIGFLTNTDVIVQSYLLEKYPRLFALDKLITLELPKTSSQTVSEIPSLNATGWINSAGLTPEQLKGKVVLVDFWTYSCINCIRTLPVLKAWYSAYEKDGLVIIGVHTPEFAFEKDAKNVADAVKRRGLTYPIALDPEYSIWNAFHNQYWPAEYLFNREGKLIHTHFGEGEYDKTESAIREALAQGGRGDVPMTGVDTTPDFGMTRTPETYFGYARAERFANKSGIQNDKTFAYDPPHTTDGEWLPILKENQWSLMGSWLIDDEKAITKSGTMYFNLESDAFHVVMGSTDGLPKDVMISLLGEDIQPGENEIITKKMFGEDLRESGSEWIVTVTRKDLYRILKFPKGGRHTVELTPLDPGVEFYAATFGE